MPINPEGRPFHPEPGECLAGKYVVDRVIGAGGMSVVVGAFHQGLRQKVAIKVLSTSKSLPPDGVARFLREARAAAALRSEHTARVVDVDVDEAGRHFIVMEHLEGEDLGHLLRRNDTLPVETAVGYVLHACEAMAEAHALGIIHRDLKPQNLFLTRHMDGTPLVKVLDFGISKVTPPDLLLGKASYASTQRTLLGTPHYMSPEQIRTPGELDGRSDIWALGVILFELLTHAEPFTGQTVPDVIASVLQGTPPSPVELRPDLPAALAAIVLACLEKEVSQRVAHVGVLSELLRPWAPVWALDAATRATRISRAAPGSWPSAEPAAWSLPLSSGRAGAAPGVLPRMGRYPWLIYAAAAALGVAGWVSFAWFDRAPSEERPLAASQSGAALAPEPVPPPPEVSAASVEISPTAILPAPPLESPPSVAVPAAGAGSAATSVAKARKSRLAASTPRKRRSADPLADRH
jgi:eukaryotic-like serine/threonine-protein kinase